MQEKVYMLIAAAAIMFAVIGGLSLAMLVMLRVMQIRWTRTWAEKGGRARSV